jgi:carbon monoxide dehydrogenase subunit G
MLKKILIALAAIVLIFVVVVALQPSEFQMDRSTTIAAPQADVFAQVNDFHKWEAWSPWAKLDPAAKVGFEGPPEGEGTVMTWSGNSEVGEGKMTLTESRPSELVKARVDMVKPFEGSSTSEFTFKPEGDQTAVTWSVAAHHNFVQKALCLVMGGKTMMSDLMEKGLAQMKSVAESKSSG